MFKQKQKKLFHLFIILCKKIYFSATQMKIWIYTTSEIDCTVLYFAAQHLYML